MTDPAVILKVYGLQSGYGKIVALKDIGLSVPAGRIVSLIGSNGAGKSTFLMTVSGLVRAMAGSIHFEGKNITNLPADQIVRLGIAQVPEGRRVFARMTVEENLDLGAYTRTSPGDTRGDKEEFFTLFPILKQRRANLAGTLSGGEQQMLAMARALMSRPKLLLLDEPSLGLAPKMVDTVFDLIRRINERGITVLLVEQNAYRALEISDYAFVLENGRNQLEGAGSALLANPLVKAAYLGSGG